MTASRPPASSLAADIVGAPLSVRRDPSRGPQLPLAPTYTFRGRRGPSLRALVGDAAVRLDPAGVRAAFGEAPATLETCIAGARRSPTAYVPGHPRGPSKPLDALLADACAHIPAGAVALALSGGVDSAVLAALLRGRAVAYTLAPAFSNYGEVDEAQAVATRLGLELRRVPVDAADFAAALPDVVRACECPLYNLHPVGRHLLARAARADGCEVLVTGDGADEVFHDRDGGDYLPVVGAIVRAVGLTSSAPFLDPALASAVAVDPDKRALRDLARALGVPAAIADRPKRARLAPPIDLSRHHDPDRITALARALGRAPDLAADRGRVAWTTLALLSRALPGLELPCAA